MIKPRASKGVKLLFGAIFLLSLTLYQTFDIKFLFGIRHQKKTFSVPSQVTHGRNLQETGDCLELFADFCENDVCAEVAPETCCKEGGLCIDANENECDSTDICVANIIPGGAGGGRCLAGFEAERALGIIVYLCLILYIFVALAIICDDYFVPCLEKISDALSLTDDVAGATFMAAGSSAPELFVSLADNVVANPPKNLGTGAVVGGGVFNVLVIIGLSAVFAGQDLHLNWRPFARDYMFYIVSVGLLVLFASDEQIEYYEGLILFLFYGTYVIFMVFNARIFIWVDTKLGLLEVVEDKEEDKKEEPVVKEAEKDELADDEADPEGDKEDGEEEKKKRRLSKSEAMKQYSSFRSMKSLTKPEEKGSYFEMFFWPETNGARAWFLLTTPINIFYRFTVPDCTFDVFCEDKDDKEENRRLGYSLGFIGCIVWIALLSHILVFCTTVFGCMIGLEPAVMGLTLLAVGTNIPDALSSIIVAKLGKGDMAVANSIGSNVFDILIGLGFPWFLAALIFDEPVTVVIADLTTALAFLGASLVFLFLILVIRKWTLDRTVGGLLLAFYVVYVLFELFITPIINENSEE